MHVEWHDWGRRCMVLKRLDNEQIAFGIPLPVRPINEFYERECLWHNMLDVFFLDWLKILDIIM